MSPSSRRRRGPWKRPPLWILAAAVALGLVAMLDFRIEAGVDLALFYAVAVAGAGWWLGRRYAIIAAALSTGLWIAAELGRLPPGEARRFTIWNGITRLIILLFVGLAAARVRADKRRLGRSRRHLEEEINRARMDRPTDLLNGRGFLERFDREIGEPSHRGLPCALAAIDVDGFRRYQDDHDVAAAEDLARRVATVVRKAIRASDTPARLGLDEFAISFWDVERDVVEKTLRRIISGIAALAAEDPEARVSASIGVAYFLEPPGDPREALRQAEKALHLARDSGRGILHVWQQEIEDQDPAAEAAPGEPVAPSAEG
jgi:diguanylate cyclase (GGDEF)-like protein